MKTKDFIKMLQEEDPSGEAHIRMMDGVPIMVQKKAGYWDGAYAYIDEEGNYVTSTRGEKVDIYCRDINAFVENEYDKNVTWEDIKRKFKFEFTYSDEKQRKEKEETILKVAKEAFLEWKEIYNKINNKQNENTRTILKKFTEIFNQLKIK